MLGYSLGPFLVLLLITMTDATTKKPLEEGSELLNPWLDRVRRTNKREFDSLFLLLTTSAFLPFRLLYRGISSGAAIGLGFMHKMCTGAC